MGWRGLREKKDSAGSHIVCADERENASVGGRVDLLLIPDGIDVARHLGKVLCWSWSAFSTPNSRRAFGYGTHEPRRSESRPVSLTLIAEAPDISMQLTHTAVVAGFHRGGALQDEATSTLCQGEVDELDHDQGRIEDKWRYDVDSADGMLISRFPRMLPRGLVEPVELDAGEPLVGRCFSAAGRHQGRGFCGRELVGDPLANLACAAEDENWIARGDNRRHGDGWRDVRKLLSAYRRLHGEL